MFLASIGSDLSLSPIASHYGFKTFPKEIWALTEYFMIKDLLLCFEVR